MGKETLKMFLEYPIGNSDLVFEKFKTLSGHIFKENPINNKERFIYIRGTKKDKVVLVAHADTFFDTRYDNEEINHFVVEENGFFIGVDNNDDRCGLGADDRAGCAIIWLLKDLGHSILIVDGEEKGKLGSNWLMDNFKEIATELNNHQFMIQFDRRNSSDFKCYDVGTENFRTFISEKTGFSEPDRRASTDICALCTDICGVNLSVGYYNEHTTNESINIEEWKNTLEIARKLLSEELPKFHLS
jgi:di/tripeptidase